ncbi:Oidioi.mRNA.OKI2018_I69.chr1.g394.t1.cds [Oikopleura dioica]|uniref:Oidioi.mRNA.OKI2018_I69.chr1.g394.t1.cds n=1 Tax=Oikopleura dioica TaxID=34765 RepID=A0ABN7SNE9_OIKDI|nr:Oidioi.mRNA.OKI2018_I69.chr1.g394.t1.cds [Oikopleura dioica]
MNEEEVIQNDQETAQQTEEPRLKRKRSSRKKRRSIKKNQEVKTEEPDKQDTPVVEKVDSKKIEDAIFDLDNQDVDRIVGPCPNCIII